MGPGGIQDRDGQIAHPGVSAAELEFLRAVYHEMQQRLRDFLDAIAYPHPEPLLAASILDNIASPTANLNTAFAQIPEHYPALQQAFGALMGELLAKARDRGLADSFFVHYAPNLGRDEEGLEILRPATTTDSGTTDFQFMLKGGIKEAGVAVLLNRYFGRYCGEFPLGEGFNVREAPHSLAELTQLILDHFDPGKMPILIGVGDTVNSQVTSTGVRRGGSDRNFLQLIHNLKQESGQPHLTVYVDSSQGEVKNRRSLQIAVRNGQEHVIAGPGDPADTDEPLVLNVAFPGGHEQYVQWFTQAAAARSAT
jgi:glucosylglycerol 3-phosphatase